jgi:O-acetyl-ADP-ribose deacetylase (regulator of RNase III)
MVMPLDLILVNPDPDMCAAWRTQFDQLPNVAVIEGLFEDLGEHDCFVTAANSFAMMTAGIDAAVVEFHGQGLMDRLQERILSEFLGEQPVGTAVIEPTGTPGYPFVAHAPTMRVPKGIDGTDAVYIATWAALVAIYRHNLTSETPIRSVAMPAMGAGFGYVPYPEVARQMAIAYDNFVHPPSQLDWDVVTARHRRLSYDGDSKVIN